MRHGGSGTDGAAGEPVRGNGCAAEVRRFLEAGHRRLDVVTNRVGRARAVFARLCGACGEEVDLLLAIGRIRPLDREKLAWELEERFAAECAQTEADSGRPAVMVGTQTLEVGADFDLDALVTEIAPLDSLRQRFGRLNRRGVRPQAPAVILARKEDVRANAEDPVYGTALTATWRWLRANAHGRGRNRFVDFGIAVLDGILADLPEEQLEPVLAPRADAPRLLPPHVGALASTSPPPTAEPEVALYLHGPRAGPPDVRLVWRADLRAEDLEDSERAREIVAALPPSSPEALEVPVWAARAWLAGRTTDLADVEGASAPGDAREGGRSRGALRWCGPDDEETGVISADQIRPGDTLVVPASYGGCDRFGWNPGSDAPVHDLAEVAHGLQRGRPVVRLHPAFAAGWADPEEDPRTPAERWEVVRTELEALGDAGADELVANLLARGDLPARLRERLEELAGLRPRLLRPYGEAPAQGCVLMAQARARPADEAVSESDVTSLGAPVPVPLADHLAAVKEKAADFAERLGLDGHPRKAVVLAAAWHDLGKAEPRFQAFLRGGDRIVALAERMPLAKSDRPLQPRLAAARAGLPLGVRHEAWSVAAAEKLLVPERDGARRELVLWLIGTHHGHGRPFFPPVEDKAAAAFDIELDGVRAVGVPGDPGLHRLDSFWFELAERVQARFGPWQLAFLEAVLRLADHRASEEAGR